MRIVFMGAAELSCPSLQALLERRGDAVVAVVCPPDRPQGRRLRPAPCPAKRAAAAAGAPVLTPADVNAPESVAALRALRPDVIVVVAYGQILKAELLALPPLGGVNIHASLLPRYRGAAPVQWAIANGETVTGVTAMKMAARLDAGEILLQEEEPIAPEDTGGTLQARLAAAGAALLMRALDGLRDGTLRGRPQDERLASYAPKLRKEDGRVDWTLPAPRIHDRVRAFDPWPGSYCLLPGGGRTLKLLATRPEPGQGRPGRVLGVSEAGPLVAAGEGAVRLLRVQPEGRRAMSGADFVRGRALAPGDVLGGEEGGR